MDPDVAVLLRRVPEFTDRYLLLVEQADGDPGTPATLGELADFAAELALQLEGLRPVLDRLMAMVEELSASADGGGDLVAGAFLDSLSPDDLRRLRPWFGRATWAILDDLELPAGTAPDRGGPRRGRPGTDATRGAP
ncbi:MAG TPA: hypothetical protein DCQ30_02675 [Acidimicrobiaceae bacterium]|nr:hypothetical protein [Acidimicrobiaceae bacterium]